MLKIKTINLAGLVLVTLIALFFINIELVSAEQKVALNKAVLLENKVELPSKSVNAKVIRVTLPPAFKTPWHTHEGAGPRYVVKGKLKVVEGGKTDTYYFGSLVI